MKGIAVNADDFGWSKSCSEAIVDAYEQGLIHTTTMMANGNYFVGARKLISHKEIESHVGIHFNLTEGAPLTEAIRSEKLICDANGYYHGRIPRYHLWTGKQKRMIYEELMAQVQRFMEYDLSVHHADSHHHIHTSPTLTPIILEVMKQAGITRLRIHRNIGNISTAKAIGKAIYNSKLKKLGVAYSDYFGGYSDVEGIDHLPQNGMIEVMCHPDFDLSGNVVDRDAESSYDAPCGKKLQDCFGMLVER